jgi:hypothetical protein
LTARARDEGLRSGVAAMSALPPINNPLIYPFSSLIQIKETIWVCKTIRPGEST